MKRDSTKIFEKSDLPISSEPPVANRNIVAFIILLGIFMFVIDGSVVSIALPTITRYFLADVAQTQWVITSYLVTVTSLLMIFGKIAERTRKVRLFLAGFVIFTMASVACGLSSTLSMLIFFRAVQAQELPCPFPSARP